MQIRFDSPVVAESGMMRIREVQIFVGGRLPFDVPFYKIVIKPFSTAMQAIG